MAFWEDFSKKVKDAAAVTAEKAKDVAAVASEKAKDTAELAKINMAIASEQRNIEKNYRAIGEWFATQYEGEIPEAVKPLLDAVDAAKVKIAELEASKPAKDKEVVAETTAPVSLAPAISPSIIFLATAPAIQPLKAIKSSEYFSKTSKSILGL